MVLGYNITRTRPPIALGGYRPIAQTGEQGIKKEKLNAGIGRRIEGAGSQAKALVLQRQRKERRQALRFGVRPTKFVRNLAFTTPLLP